LEVLVKVKPLFCVCGKLCTSNVGLILHQRKCSEAKDALKAGKPTTRESDITIPHDDFEPDLTGFIDLAEEVIFDAHLAYVDKNKSAGRRARTNLIKLRKLITPLRANILGAVK
jgi:hypothetical protein